MCYVFIGVCANVCVFLFIYLFHFMAPEVIFAFKGSGLKAKVSRPSKIRNAKVRQSGAQMCLCVWAVGVCAQEISLCTFRFASGLNDPMQNVPCGWSGGGETPAER